MNWISTVRWARADIVITIPQADGPGATQIVSDTFLGVSAIGVQNNGATLYAATAVESFVALVHAGGVTETILTTPTTVAGK